MNCSVKSYPIPIISWLKNGIKITPQKNKFSIFFDGESSTLKIFNIDANDFGKYTFVAENNLGKIENSLDLIVETENSVSNSAPKFVNTKQKIKKTAENQSVQLKAEIVEGSEPIQIKWLFNKMEITENMNLKCLRIGNDAILEIHDAFPEDSGEYICLAENDFGSAKCCINLTVIGKFKTAPVLEDVGAQKKMKSILASIFLAAIDNMQMINKKLYACWFSGEG
uniref:Ig-like domain-containing protein n=1 Tax=Panagrolaimus sp. JU765 TaxID=591449 RepID=A0AC34PXA4_9BILA